MMCRCLVCGKCVRGIKHVHSPYVTPLVVLRLSCVHQVSSPPVRLTAFNSRASSRAINLGARAWAGVFFFWFRVYLLVTVWWTHTRARARARTHTHQFHRATALLYLSTTYDPASALSLARSPQDQKLGSATQRASSPRTASAVASICDQAYGARSSGARLSTSGFGRRIGARAPRANT